MIATDIEEESQKLISALDYIAMYINPEGLQRVRDLRDGGSKSTNNYEIGDGSVVVSRQSDEQFAQFLADNSEDGSAPIFNKR